MGLSYLSDCNIYTRASMRTYAYLDLGLQSPTYINAQHCNTIPRACCRCWGGSKHLRHMNVTFPLKLSPDSPPSRPIYIQAPSYSLYYSVIVIITVQAVSRQWLVRRNALCNLMYDATISWLTCIGHPPIRPSIPHNARACIYPFQPVQSEFLYEILRIVWPEIWPLLDIEPCAATVADFWWCLFGVLNYFMAFFMLCMLLL